MKEKDGIYIWESQTIDHVSNCLHPAWLCDQEGCIRRNFILRKYHIRDLYIGTDVWCMSVEGARVCLSTLWCSWNDVVAIVRVRVHLVNVIMWLVYMYPLYVMSLVGPGLHLLSFFVMRLLCCTKLELTKRSVMPQSRRPFVNKTMPVSVVCIKIGSWRDFEPRVIATMYCLGSCFSHFGCHGSCEHQGDVGGVAFISFIVVVRMESISVNLSTGNAAKRLCTDSGGTPSTHCPCQDSVSPLCPLYLMISFPLLQCPEPQTCSGQNFDIPRCPCSKYWIISDNPFGYVWLGRIGSKVLLRYLWHFGQQGCCEDWGSKALWWAVQNMMEEWQFTKWSVEGSSVTLEVYERVLCSMVLFRHGGLGVRRLWTPRWLCDFHRKEWQLCTNFSGPHPKVDRTLDTQHSPECGGSVLVGTSWRYELLQSIELDRWVRETCQRTHWRCETLGNTSTSPGPFAR